MTPIQILVQEIFRDTDILEVKARCERGPIQIGDVFEFLYRPIKLPSNDGGQDISYQDMPISLEVTHINIRGESVQQLQYGDIGLIQLIGSLNPTIQVGDALGTPLS